MKPRWEEVTGPIELRKAGVRALAVDGDDTLYLEANLVEEAWRSTDGGATWTATPRRPRSTSDEQVVEAVDAEGARWRSVRRHDLTFHPGSRPEIVQSAPLIKRRVERHDGKSWRVLRDDLEAFAFAFAGDGRVWIAADGMGLWGVEELRWRQVLAARTTAVAVAGERLVVVTNDAVLLSTDGGEHFQPCDAGLGQEATPRFRVQWLDVQKLLGAPDGTVWAFGHKRVCRLAPAALTWENLDAGLPQYLDKIEGFALTRGGVAWVGTRFKGLYRLLNTR